MESAWPAQSQPREKTQGSRPRRLCGGGGERAMAGRSFGLGSLGPPPDLRFYPDQRCEVAPCQVAERCQNPQSPGKVWIGGPWESRPICGGVDSDSLGALMEAPTAREVWEGQFTSVWSCRASRLLPPAPHAFLRPLQGGCLGGPWSWCQDLWVSWTLFRSRRL